ncbi:MAG: serine hydrolase [Saprospiraceae bacterium]|nr:serine hydrolase [Saprospiraceae bacterium]
MKLIIRFSALIFTVFFLSNNCHGQKSADDISSKIDSLIQTTNPRGFNGVILITQKGKKIYSKAHGYADFEKKIPLSLNDKFRIQSNSKQITAVLILKRLKKET